MPDQYFDLTPEQAVELQKQNVEDLRASDQQDELLDQVTPDMAFILGYETAIFDYIRYTSPDPLSIELVTITPTEENDDDTTTD
jgi:hypothetical protein